MKNPFLMFAVSDHLSETGLRLSPAFARGVWIDMLCLMASGEPYGYLRRQPQPPRDSTKQRGHGSAEHAGHGSAKQRGHGSAEHAGHGSAIADDPLQSLDDARLPPSGSIEGQLSKLTATAPAVIEKAIQILESNGVFSRVKDGEMQGVIYSRRMVREYERRQQKAKAASSKRSGRKQHAGHGSAEHAGHGSAEHVGHGSAEHVGHGSAIAARTPIRSRTRSRDLNPSPNPSPQAGKGQDKKSGSGTKLERDMQRAADIMREREAKK